MRTNGDVVLSVVIPVFNEEDNLKPLHTRLTRVMRNLKKPYEIIFFLFPLLAVIRLIGNARQRRSGRKIGVDMSLEIKTVPAVNEVFLGLLRLERFLLRYFNLPFGASLMVLAEKK